MDTLTTIWQNFTTNFIETPWEWIYENFTPFQQYILLTSVFHLIIFWSFCFVFLVLDFAKISPFYQFKIQLVCIFSLLFLIILFNIDKKNFLFINIFLIFNFESFFLVHINYIYI